MILLEKEFAVFPENEKTNISFPFAVPEGADSLKFTFSYSPKVLCDDERAKWLIENNIKKDAGENVLEKDNENISGKVLRLASREDVDIAIEEHLIVELYSK